MNHSQTSKKPPACATARLSGQPVVGIASSSVPYLTAAVTHANAQLRTASEASVSQAAGLQSAILSPDRRNCRTAQFSIKRASDAQGYTLPRLRFLLTPPILTDNPSAMNGQGGTDEGAIHGVDEAINSRASTAALFLGDKEIGEEINEQCCM